MSERPEKWEELSQMIHEKVASECRVRRVDCEALTEKDLEGITECMGDYLAENIDDCIGESEPLDDDDDDQ